MPRWVIVLATLFGVAAVALVGTSLVDTLFTRSHMTPEPRSPAAPTVPPPSAPVPSVAAPAPAASASNTETGKKLDEALKRLAELEDKLKAGAGDKRDADTKSQTWGEWFASWKGYTISSPPKLTTSPTATPPAATERPKSKSLEALDKTMKELGERLKAKSGAESISTPKPPSIATPPKAATAPVVPPPPPAIPVTLKAPGSFFSNFFTGGCSARHLEVTLGDDWTQLTGSGKDECLVVYDFDNAIILAKDGKGEYQLTKSEGVVGRNPRAVKLVAGNGYFRYSTCDPRLNGQALDWECQPKRP